MSPPSQFSEVHHYNYFLVPQTHLGKLASSNPRQGALLRFSFSDGSTGYSDCHPWTELGDFPLSEQLDLLKSWQFTHLTRRSGEFARADAQSRLLGRSLWDRLTVPPSHKFWPDVLNLHREEILSWKKEGFTRAKFKVGSAPAAEAAVLARFALFFEEYSIRIRLDFNSLLTRVEFEEFIERLGSARRFIDFVEDPIPYDSKTWTQIQRNCEIRLALDRLPPGRFHELDAEAISVFIIKPAFQDPEPIVDLAKNWGKTVVVTSYLDHPIGQLSAAWTSAQIAARDPECVEVCGLLSHLAYRPNEFSEQLNTQGAQLIPSVELGFGMTKLLENLPWKPLV